MWVRSFVWLFTMKEYNKTPLIQSPRNFMIRRAMKLDLESCLDASKLDVWLDVFDLKFRAIGLISNKIEGKSLTTLIWRSRNKLDFEGAKVLFWTRIWLYILAVSVGFFSLCLCVLFFIWEVSIYRQLNGI